LQLSEKADLVARGLFTKHAELQYVREKQRRDTEQSTNGNIKILKSLNFLKKTRICTKNTILKWRNLVSRL
jgi:hypothetical protein